MEKQVANALNPLLSSILLVLAFRITKERFDYIECVLVQKIS